MKRVYRCCICGKVFYGFGNNPWPVSNDEKDRCCDECNSKVVLTERIKLMYGKGMAEAYARKGGK